MYTKTQLQELGKTAARNHLQGGEPLQEAIAKVAKRESITGEGIDRLCNYANHAVNRKLMKKTAYTQFDVANPNGVRAVMNKKASVPFVPMPKAASNGAMDKTASAEENAPAYQEGYYRAFSKMAEHFHAPFHLTGHPHEDVKRFIKSAEGIGHEALEQLFYYEKKASDGMEEAYNIIKTLLLEGYKKDQIQRKMKEKGMGGAWNTLKGRLRAEGLLRDKVHEDDGPYSIQRALKTSQLRRYEETFAPHERPVVKEASLPKTLERAVGKINEAYDLAKIAVRSLSVVEASLSNIDAVSENHGVEVTPKIARMAKEADQRLSDKSDSVSLVMGINKGAEKTKPTQGAGAGRKKFPLVGGALTALFGGAELYRGNQKAQQRRNMKRNVNPLKN